MGKLPTSNRFLALGRSVVLFGAVAALMAAAPPEKAAEPPAKSEKTKHVKPSLICDQDGATPGSTVTLGITLEIRPKWHVYWPGRNENGLPPSADFQLPAGFATDAIQWPGPVRHIEPGDLLNHVYFDTVTLLVPLRVPPSAQPGSTAVIKAKLSWMACEEACVGEQAEVSLKLPIVSAKERPQRSSDAKTIDAARARIPRELPKDCRDVRITWSSEVVKVAALGATHMTFFPYEDCVPFADAIMDADADRASLAIRLGDPEKEHPDLAGVLEIRRGKEAPEYFVVRSTPPAGSTANPVPGLRPTDLHPSPSPEKPPTNPKPNP